jgi:uncharacterized NAD(P)/FAD-binding protein YdhS
LAALLRTIAIVGGGFSGVVVAVNLLRRPPSGPTRIVLLERSGDVGRGVAYARRGFPYLLNVPASRMSANSAAPEEFLRFAQRRIPRASGEDFLPRALYGDYLQEALLAAELSAPSNVRLQVRRAEVVNVRRVDRSAPLQVELADGESMTADDVVLACGNPPPAPLAAASAAATHPAFVPDPWAVDLNVAAHEQILLIGAGLTAADFVTAATADERRTPTFHLLSRHGLVPPRQTAFRPDAFRGDGKALLAAATSLRGLTHSVRLLAREAERCGGDWREAITFVRATAPSIWARMPERDRRRFLRHLRAYWDAHRHRLAPQALERIESLRRRERLYVHAGRIEACHAAGDRIEVVWRERRGGAIERRAFDRVVNCTGPDYAIARSTEPLWRNLLQCGLAVPDALGLGLRTGPHGAVMDADGWPAPHLFYVGPMLRADWWEATAAAELRTHAEALAALLAAERD